VGSSDTLRSVIDAGRSSKRLDELSSARVVGKIAQQIHAAQQKAGAGKAVGPISPAHIKLAENGEATLDITPGASLGYSAPEQTMGGNGDRRSDVFSLGTVLWEALTHQRLFDAMNDAAVRMAVQEREIQAPSEVNANIPAELSAICMRALARNPADRYQSLKAMAVEIEEFLEEAGYGDDDTKIAAYLASLGDTSRPVKIDMPPLTRPASSSQPPASERAKTPSGAALAAALANASTSSSANKGLPQASPATTAVGVPKLADWQDSAQTAHSHSAPPPNAAPVVPADASPSASAATPLPPVLPSGSTPMRNDKATIIGVSIPKATVEAKHTEAKNGEAKQPAMLVDAPATSNGAKANDAKIVQDKHGAIVDDGKMTLVDNQPPEVVVPKLVDGKLPSAIPTVAVSAVAPADAAAKAAEPAKPADAKAAEAKPDAKAADTKAADAKAAVPAKPAAHADAKKPERAGSQSDAPKRPGSHSDAQRPGSHSDAKSPHPVAAVSLGPGPGGRDSKDLLGNWGWGTDKHAAITDGYAGDDDYDFHAEHNPKKTLMYVIGGGFALAALVTILALSFGGSSSKKKATAAEKQVDTSRTAVDTPAPTPAPPPSEPAQVAAAPAGSAGSDTASASGATPVAESGSAGSAAAQPAVDPAAEAARIEQEKQQAAEQAKQAELAKAEAAKQEAARLAAEKEAAKKAEADQKAEAARLAAEAKKTEADKKAEAARLAAEAKKAEAARIAADKEAKRQEAARIAAEKAQAKKAEAARLAAEKEAKRKEAARVAAEKAAKQPKTTARPTTTARPATAKKPETKVATAPKVDVEATYRQGLQQFARGDTNGALASLRQALAANPNYAPTWRGMGLVYEKLGEKDQARTAFKRYLQLAPSAGDAEQIRSRLERLGS
jgi:hypothetical protein